MPGASLLTLSWILWASVTTVFVGLMIWKSLIGLKEEDIVILDPAEDRWALDQQMIVAKIQRVTLWAKRFGYASLALLLMAGGILAYQGYVSFNGGQIR